MEFSFDVNLILPNEINIINGDYRILNHGQAVRISYSDKLSSIIDAIGEASYKAQGLPGPVTTSRKFRISDHRLYLVKNPSDNNNRGSVVGLLKVGEKRLYVHDSQGQVHERTPLCVLDFFVHESKQRSGYGKKLFEAMLEFEKCNAYDLAIDRPSKKCLAFLQKHYNLTAPIHQVNNFVVYHGFFSRPTIAQHRRLSSKQRNNDGNLLNDPFRRQEPPAWVLPPEKQQQQQQQLPQQQNLHRPLTEQSEYARNSRLRMASNENDVFNNRRQATILENPVTNNERKPFSAYATSYNQNYGNSSFMREQPRPNEIAHSAPYMPRLQAQLFSENNPFPSLQRYNTNPAMPSTNKQSAQTQQQQQPYSYKDYQASINDPHRNVDNQSQNVPLTSIYTFPSLMRTNSNWRRPYQQPSTIDATSSAWKLFGTNRLLN